MPLDASASDNVSADTIAEHIRLYRTQKRKCEEEQGVLRSIVKKAKSYGLNTASMIEAVNATKLDPDVVASDLRDTLRYMRIVRIPLSQEALFDWSDNVTTKTSQDDDLWDAEDRGYRAGRHGAAIEECPYTAGTELHVHWLEHWRKGQATIARELGDNAKQADSAKIRPTRSEQQPRLASQDGTPVVNLSDRVKKPRKPRAASAPTGRPRGRPRRLAGSPNAHA